jgi:hypothetical protein
MIEINVEEETRVELRRCSQEALDSFGTLEVVKVNGDLRLYYCTGITKLPDGLKVNGYLSLWDCKGLTKLPDGLIVRGGVHLSRCSGIKKLPDDLHTGEEISYDSDTGFYGRVHVPGVIPKHLKHKLKYTEW